jgi:hypothetical protein
VNNATQGFDRFYTWIGLQAIQGQFSRWTDGSPVDYTAWEAGKHHAWTASIVIINDYRSAELGNQHVRRLPSLAADDRQAKWLANA